MANMNQNMFGGYNSPMAAKYGSKLKEIQKYVPKYGSTDPGSIDWMYANMKQLEKAKGSTDSKVSARLSQLLREQVGKNKAVGNASANTAVAMPVADSIVEVNRDSGNGSVRKPVVDNRPKKTVTTVKNSSSENKELEKLGVGVPSNQTFEVGDRDVILPALNGGLASSYVQQGQPTEEEMYLNKANAGWGGTYDRGDGTPKGAYYSKDGEAGTIIFNPTNMPYDVAERFGLAYRYSR